MDQDAGIQDNTVTSVLPCAVTWKLLMLSATTDADPGYQTA